MCLWENSFIAYDINSNDIVASMTIVNKNGLEKRRKNFRVNIFTFLNNISKYEMNDFILPNIIIDV